MKKFWKATGISAAYFGVFMGIQFLISFAGILILMGSMVHDRGMAIFANPAVFEKTYMEGLLKNMTAMVLVSNTLTVGGLWAFFALRHKKFGREIGFYRTSGRNLGMSVIFGVGVCFFVDLLTTYLPFPETAMAQFEAQHGMLWFGDVGLTFLSVALVGPVSEEICFRGLCYSRLREGMRPWAAALISSIFFGLAHGDPIWFFVGFLAGISLSWIFQVTGSLYCAIVVHVTNNAISTVTSYFSMPDYLHKILIFSSLFVVALAGWFLYRWNHIPVEKSQVTE